MILCLPVGFCGVWCTTCAASSRRVCSHLDGKRAPACGSLPRQPWSVPAPSHAWPGAQAASCCSAAAPAAGSCRCGSHSLSHGGPRMPSILNTMPVLYPIAALLSLRQRAAWQPCDFWWAMQNLAWKQTADDTALPFIQKLRQRLWQGRIYTLMMASVSRLQLRRMEGLVQA